MNKNQRKNKNRLIVAYEPSQEVSQEEAEAKLENAYDILFEAVLRKRQAKQVE